MYDAILKIVIFGDFFEERQALFDKFLTNFFVSDNTMTVGVDFKSKSLTVDGLKVKLQVDDFDGKERFKWLLPIHMRLARGGLFVYDVTNYSSLAHIDDWLSIINFNKDIKIEDLIPIVVVGIVPDEMCERQVSAEEGIKIAKSRNLNGFIECNLKTGKNVEKAFEVLTSLMLEALGHQRRIKKEAKGKTKDEESIITYTRHLEKRLRNLEAENLRLEEQIRLEKQKNQLELKQDLNDLQNEIDKYKKMGI